MGSFFGDSDDSFVAALQVEDRDKLDELIERSKAREVGEVSGATLYDENGTVFAVEDDTIVVAGSRALLEGSARAPRRRRRARRGHTFEQGLEGLPDDAIARVYADVQALLEGDPDTREARKVEWIGALRTLGLTASVSEDAIEIDFDLRTDSDGLTEEDLPIASGSESPDIVKRSGEIGVGIRNIAQTVKFVEAAAQAIDPSGYGDYAAAKRTIEKRLGVDIDADLIDQLNGDLSATISLDGDFGVRAELDDPAAFQRTLAKVADTLPAVAEGAGLNDVAIVKPKRGEDFYALAEPDGDSIVFGVVDEAFVLANDPGAPGSSQPRVRAPCGAPRARWSWRPTPRSSPTSCSPRSSPLELPPGVLTKPLGDLTGSVAADTDGLTGRLSLEIE